MRSRNSPSRPSKKQPLVGTKKKTLQRPHAHSTAQQHREILAVLMVFFILVIASIWLTCCTPHLDQTNHGLRLGGMYAMLQSHRHGTPKEEEAGGIACKYEGHCPIGTTCVASSSMEGGGQCFPYRSHEKRSPKDAKDATFVSCVERCRNDLVWDESFFFKAQPVLEWAEQTSNQQTQHYYRPGVCVLVYHRISTGKDEPSPEAWKEGKFGSIVRVDPLMEPSLQHKIPTLATPNSGNLKPRRAQEKDVASGTTVSKMTEQKWMALCYNPCKTDSDCLPSSTTPSLSSKESSFLRHAYSCINQSCVQRQGRSKPQTPPKSQPNQDQQHDIRNNNNHHNHNNTGKYQTPPEMVIVTGADKSYFTALSNLAASLRYWAPQHKLIIYNLGLSPKQIKKISSWANVHDIGWRDTAIPSFYPPHFKNLKEYAWKPVVINETLHQYKSVLWLDAGCQVAAPLDRIEEYLYQTGIFLVKGQDLGMESWSHPQTYQYFNQSKDTFDGGPHYGGNVQAYLSPSRYVDTVVIPNAECSLQKECIAPEGSNLRNHRYDQTTLSILAYGKGMKVPHHTELLAAEKRQLNRDFLEESERVVWTARGGSKWFLQHGY